MVMQPTADFLVGGSNPGWANMAAAAARRRQSFDQDSNCQLKNLQSTALPFDWGWCDSNKPPHCLEPSEQKLCPPPPQKSDLQFSGIEALESKNPLGDCLIGQNNDFTKGWTSNIMPWGMRMTPKKGGIRRPRLRLI